MRALPPLVFSLLAAASAPGASADTTAARCEVHADGRVVTQPCTFSQRQGHVTIRRDDGVVHELAPVGDRPGNFHDRDGRPVYRQRGLGDRGLIFALPEQRVLVYWDTTPLREPDPDNVTWPFTTDDYDATTLLRCRAIGAAEYAFCPAGIQRMQGGRASITVRSPSGAIFTINFMKEYVNAANREVDASYEDDTWSVVIDGTEVYQVPLAAIEGG